MSDRVQKLSQEAVCGGVLISKLVSRTEDLSSGMSDLSWGPCRLANESNATVGAGRPID